MQISQRSTKIYSFKIFFSFLFGNIKLYITFGSSLTKKPGVTGQRHKIMTTIEFEVYKSEDGSFSRKPETRTVNPSIRTYLMSTLNDEEKQAFLARSSKQNKQRLYRAGQSEGYRVYCEANKTVYNSHLYGKVTAQYDGRLREGSVIVAILHALKDGSTTMRVEPASNATKPAHLQMVYIKEFLIEVYK